ncbi:MAG: hypothetical protein ACOZAQ_05155 [Pseudomonadota bacterium]
MRRASKFLTSLAAASLLTGCASVGVTSIKQFPPKPENCALDVFSSEKEVAKPFTVACVLDSSTGTTLFHDRTAAAAIEQAKAQACACGADAIIIGGMANEGISAFSWGRGAAVVKAIKYTRD